MVKLIVGSDLVYLDYCANVRRKQYAEFNTILTQDLSALF